jgi:chromosome segregation ATPase
VYVFELASYLFLAILFGIGIGWLIWGDEPFEASAAAGAGGDEEVVNDLTAQVETRDQEIVRLRKRLKRMHADLDAKDVQVNEIKGQHSEAQALLSQREDELSGMLNGGELPTGVADVHVRRLSELEEELAASRAESDGLARKLQDIIATPTVVSTDVGPLEEQIASLSDSHSQLIAAHEELQLSHGAISNDLAEAQARLEEVSSSADLSQHDRVRVLEDEIARVKAEAHARTEKLAEAQEVAQRKIKEHEVMVEKLGSQLHIAQTAGSAPGDATELDLELAKAQAELTHSRQNASTLRQRLQSIEDENETLAGELARASTELQGRSAKSAEAIAERDKLQQEIAHVRAGSSELEQRLEAAEAEAKSAAAAAQQLEEHVHKTEAAEAERTALQEQLHTVKAEHDTTMKQLHLELSEARVRADSSYDALHELNDEFIAFREATIRQQTTMNSLADRLAKANSSLGSRSTPVVPAPDADDSAGR